jgi:hypothetical protein
MCNLMKVGKKNAIASSNSTDKLINQCLMYENQFWN